MAPVAATQLPDLRGEAHAGGLDEPGLWLYRSNLFRPDLRIANFGGGDASAQVSAAATPRPRSKRPIRSLARQ